MTSRLGPDQQARGGGRGGGGGDRIVFNIKEKAFFEKSSIARIKFVV